MFDKAKAESLGRKKVSSMEPEPLKKMNVDDLRKIKAEVDTLLGVGLSMDDINLEKELVQQFTCIKNLQSTVIGDPDIPANQKAQVAGQVTSTLHKLIQMQIDMQRDERLKLIESTLLEAIESLPENVKTSFFTRYETLASKNGASS